MSAAAFWFIQGPGWLLLGYLIVAQCLPAFSYDLGVRMGTQEPAAHVTEVGVAFWKGFCGGDLLVYVPLLGAGLAGHALGTVWGITVLAAALGVTAYWPVVSLWTLSAATGRPGWALPNARVYWIVLPAIALWGAAALVVLTLTVF